uniref:Uncharacterized protein n=1 Tax=viral metagenome TaxID=1070528 RepID=A0A6C0DVL3_9ZZZZ
MNSSIDYTPVLLAQLTDLQMRVTKQDATIAALKADVERLTGHSVCVSDASTMRTSVPLRPSAQEYKPRNDFRPRSPLVPRDARDVRGGGAGGASAPRSRPRVAGTNSGDAVHKHPTMSLSDVLKKDESVTIQVGTGKDAEGKFTYTTAQATFDGTDLTVTACELVKSLVGMKSSKPGEILYKFIDELKNAGYITKTFTIAPWRLCSVVRNGSTMTLEQLRSNVG